MKQVLALVLVLGLASVANAGFVANVSAPSINLGATTDVSIVGSGNGIDAVSFYLISQDKVVLSGGTNVFGGDFAYIAPSTLIDESDASAGTWGGFFDSIGMANVTSILAVAFADTTEPFSAINGTLASGIQVSGLGLGSGAITLINAGADGLPVIGTAVVNVIPEPATMLLLGLGGMFFARKK